MFTILKKLFKFRKMEKCKKCSKQIAPGYHFCSYCNSYADRPELGKQAGLFKRWLAYNFDILIYILTLTVAMWVAFAKGNTPAHAILGMKFIKTDGSKTGFGTMLLRELVGKSVSFLFFGLGFYWAIWDRDRQAWHDKIAGTLVLEKQ